MTKSKSKKNKSDLTKTQKIRTKLSIEADSLRENTNKFDKRKIKDVKLLKIKNRIESGYYDLQDVKNELIESLFDRIFEDEID